MGTVVAEVGDAILRALLDAITFPWWWYTRGLRRVAAWAMRILRGWERAVGLRLWARHLFTPMFGQTDWQGRAISVLMRLAVLLGRLLQVLLGSLTVLVVLLAYLLLPLLVLWQVAFGLFA